jgi:hypothetical protein
MTDDELDELILGRLGNLREHCRARQLPLPAKDPQRSRQHEDYYAEDDHQYVARARRQHQR